MTVGSRLVDVNHGYSQIFFTPLGKSEQARRLKMIALPSRAILIKPDHEQSIVPMTYTAVPVNELS